MERWLKDRIQQQITEARTVEEFNAVRDEILSVGTDDPDVPALAEQLAMVRSLSPQ